MGVRLVVEVVAALVASAFLLNGIWLVVRCLRRGSEFGTMGDSRPELRYLMGTGSMRAGVGEIIAGFVPGLWACLGVVTGRRRCCQSPGEWAIPVLSFVLLGLGGILLGDRRST